LLDDRYRVCVFGAGGVGGYIAGRLAQCGANVSVIARGEHLRAIQENGLRISGISGEFIASVTATDRIGSVGEVDLVIVACKSWQVSSIAPSLIPLVGKETLVVTTQNGVEAPQFLSEGLGRRGQILGGYVKIHSKVAAPGHILHNGVPKVIFGIGPLPGAAPFVPAQLARLARVVENLVGLAMPIEEDIWKSMWSKLALIASYSGVCTAARCNVGEMCSTPQTAELLRKCIHEGGAVARALGVNLTPEDCDRIYRDIQNVAKEHPTNTTSLMRDMLAGLPSELDEQLGAVLRFADSAGQTGSAVQAPTISMLYATLLPQEQRNRAKHGLPPL